jgi:hypothetical protein
MGIGKRGAFRWLAVAGIGSLVASAFIASNISRIKTLIDPFDLEDERRYLREQSAIETAYRTDRVALRQDTLTKMRSDPSNAGSHLSDLSKFERRALAKTPTKSIVREASNALETQLEALKILEYRPADSTDLEFGGWAERKARRNILDFAVLAKRSDILREHATIWAEAPRIGAKPDDWEKHDGSQYLGWADLIDGDLAGAAANLKTSASFMEGQKLSSVGPSTKLADALVSKGRSTDVMEWLEKVGQHWKPEVTKAWIRILKKGGRPTDDQWTSLLDYH